MGARMLRKGLAVAVILLFIGMCVVPSTGTTDIKQITMPIGNEVNQYLNEKPVEHISLFYADVWMHIEKESLKRLSGGGSGQTHAYYLHFDANLDELRIELVLNYTAEMNYTLKFPFVPAPIFALGIKIQNITKYEWEYFKLKHHGYFTRCGNFSIVFNIDMTSIESGDELKIQPIISMMILPLDFTDSTNKSWGRIIRLIYHIPFLNELLLSNWLFPKFAIYEHNHYISAPLFLFFD